jgi:putative NADH-flavin reductase
MKLVIFGASGRTGQHCVRQALAKGHDITAVVRDPSRIDIVDDHVTVVRANVFDPTEIGGAIAGADAVISALGESTAAQPNVCRDGVRSIMLAMRETGARRLVAVSNSAHTPGRGDRLPRRAVQLLLRPILRIPFTDVRNMEIEIAASDLDWTVIQAARMTDGPPTGQYRLVVDEHVPGGWKIARADVADAILRVIEDGTTVRKVLAQAY